jgi:hypothetical protein
MKPAGPRQEVAYLSLAVAVLAIAVALFVGIRSLPRREKPKPPAVVAAAAPTARQPAARAPGSGKRDPFAARQAKPGEAGGKGQSEGPLRLVGVVHGKQPLAVIRRGERRYYAKLGDSVSGYTLVGIGADQVTLRKGSERLKLPLHGEEPETVSQ